MLEIIEKRQTTQRKLKDILYCAQNEINLECRDTFPAYTIELGLNLRRYRSDQIKKNANKKIKIYKDI